MHPASLRSLGLLVSILSAFATLTGCTGSPQPVSADQARGQWTIDAQTILDYAQVQTAQSPTDAAESQLLLALAAQVGADYQLHVDGDGAWQLRAPPGPASAARQTTLFAQLLHIDPRSPQAQKFYRDHHLPIDPSRPCSGTWRIDPQGMAHYQALDTGSPPTDQLIRGTGIIRRSERGIEWVQDGSGATLRFVRAQGRAGE